MSDKDRIITGYKEYSVKQLADIFWAVHGKPYKLLTLTYDETCELLDFIIRINSLIMFPLNIHNEEDEYIKEAKEINDFQNKYDVSICNTMFTLVTQRLNKDFAEYDVKLFEYTQKIYEQGITEDNIKPDSKANKKLFARQIGLIYHYNNKRLPSHGSTEANKTLEKELEHISIKYKDYLEKPHTNTQSFSDSFKRYEGRHNRIGFDTKRGLNQIKKDIELIIELELIEGEALKTAKEELTIIENKLSELE